MARICVIRQWNFPNDPRVGREVDALTRAGHEVDVICVKFPNQARFERTGRVTAYRIPIARRRGGGLRYLFEFATFMIAASLLVTALHLRRRYAIVQVNSIPDSLVFAALIPKLLGARVVLDLHECMPEFFGTKYGLAREHRLVKALMKVEAASIAFADAVTTCTDPMRDRFIERGAPRDKVRVILNTADEDVYDSRRFAGRGEHRQNDECAACAEERRTGHVRVEKVREIGRYCASQHRRMLGARSWGGQRDMARVHCDLTPFCVTIPA